MKKILYLLFVLSSFTPLHAQQLWSEDLILTPEKSNFEKTSTYADVMNFIQAIQTKSPYIQVSSIGKSPMGKDIPLVILANPAVSTPEQARASGKMITYVQGNIHAGEVDGKEAVMMLMRDILLGKRADLLENQIILFVPIYNTDSNDKMAKGLRPSQENSPVETGERENSQGLDLNRDGIKMETPETQGLIQNLVNAWDPQMSVDLHTTNGTWHGYSLTWAPSYLYAGEPATYEYTNDSMLPAITSRVKEKYGLFFGPFGDFSVREGWPLKNFYTYNHHPRYIVNQFGLRNRMAILSESFAHERFYQRIYSTYTFVTEILEYCSRHGKDIRRINEEAEKATISNVVAHAGKLKKGVRFKMVPTGKPLDHFRSYAYSAFTRADGSTTMVKNGNIVTYDHINYYGAFKDTVQSLLPRGYILPAAYANIAALLAKQGVKVEQLSRAEKITGEVFIVEKLNRAPRKFEGHFMASAEGHFETASRNFAKGDYKVDLAQPLANLAFYMLEPQSDDGLLNWNFFDAYLDLQGANTQPVEFPVFKYYAWPEPLKKKGKK